MTQAALAAAVLVTYRLGVQLGSTAAGFAAALLLAGYTEVVLESRVFMLDLPLTALVAGTVLALLRSEGFSRPGWCVVAGLLGGLGLLTKWTYPVFVGPVAVAVWLAAEHGVGRARRARGLALALAVAVVLASPWYLRHPGLAVSLTQTAFASGAAEGDPAVGTAGSWIWYLRALVFQLGPVFAALFAAGFALALARHRRGLGILLVWLVAPLVFFALLRNKDYRYTLPCLPAVALLSTVWIERLGARHAALAAGGIALAVWAQVAFLGWGWPAPEWARGRMERELLFPSFPPLAERWPIAEILERVSRDRPPGRERVTLAVVPDFIFFSPYTFAYYAARDARPVRVTRAWTGPPRFVDYVVTKGGDQGPEHTTGAARALMARLEAGDPTLVPLLRRIATLPLPDGSRATLYRLRARPVPGIAAAAVLDRLRAEAPRALDWVVRDADGLTLDVTPYSDAETLAGRLERVTLRAGAARIGDFRRKPTAIRVQDADLALEDVRLDPHALAERGEVVLLDARRLVIRRAVVAESDLALALAGVVPWLDRPVVSIRAGEVDVAGHVGGLRVAATLRPQLEPDGGGRLSLWAGRARLGPVPLPPPVVNVVLGLWNPVVRLGVQPLEIAVPRLALAPGRLVLETPAP